MPLHPNLVRGAFQQIHGHHEEAESDEEFDLMDLGEDVTEQLYVRILSFLSLLTNTPFI